MVPVSCRCSRSASSSVVRVSSSSSRFAPFTVKVTFDMAGASAVEGNLSAAACALTADGAAVMATDAAPTINKSRRVISGLSGLCILCSLRLDIVELLDIVVGAGRCGRLAPGPHPAGQAGSRVPVRGHCTAPLLDT
ncbi:hypothetical protein MESS4_510027 [Mesorhizobium sp. STM 4661]|nr:hypothetical protein MESS4_510027 [Mesorhizobium sp. STM 4661]